MDDVSLEDDKEEEQSQHHVAKVTEDVVERAVEGGVGQKMLHLWTRTPGGHLEDTHLRAPSGWAHRKL